jgi:hypothetical protein
MTDVFNRLYSKIISEMSSGSFDFETYGMDSDGRYEKAGDAFQIDASRKPGKPRRAVRMDSDGGIKTKEGMASYKEGDWIVTDDNGGQYPVPGTKKSDDDQAFSDIYDLENPVECQKNEAGEVVSGLFNAQPQSRRFFRTAKELKITTEWGTYIASVGDYVRIVAKKDGSNAKYDCPVKPADMQSGYDFIREVPPSENYEVTDKSNVQE